MAISNHSTRSLYSLMIAKSVKLSRSMRRLNQNFFNFNVASRKVRMSLGEFHLLDPLFSTTQFEERALLRPSLRWRIVRVWCLLIVAHHMSVCYVRTMTWPVSRFRPCCLSSVLLRESSGYWLEQEVGPKVRCRSRLEHTSPYPLFPLPIPTGSYR